MIDVLRVNSFPKELEDCIMNHFSKMSYDITSKIKNNEIICKSDIRCAVEDYLRPSKAESLYSNLIAIMDKFDLVVYHGTRIINRAVIEKKGLRVNDWKRYSTSLISVFKEIGWNDYVIEEILKCVEAEHNRKYSNRNAQLYFFSSLNLIGGKYAGYEQFCENIGGELVKWALEDKYPEKYNLLKKKGEAVFVKFKLPFASIESYMKESIIYQFVCYYAAKEFFDFVYQVEFDGMTSQDISPNNILKILACPMDIVI